MDIRKVFGANARKFRYEAMERAATLRGLTLTAYVTATMGEDG
jgi:hypothetical protein